MKVNQNIGTDVIITAEVRKRLNGEMVAKMKDTRQQRTRLPGGTRGQPGHRRTREWADEEQEQEAGGLAGEPREDQKMVLETETKQGYKAVEGTLSKSESKTGEKPCEDNMKSV